MRCIAFLLVLGMLAGCGRLGFERVVVGEDGSIVFLDGGQRDSGADAQVADASVDAGMDDAAIVPGTAVVDGDSSINNFDSSTNGAEPLLVCGRDMGGPLNYPIVRFDLSAVSGPITRALLRLYQFNNRGSATFTVTVHRILDAWDESVADWDTATSTAMWTNGGAIDLTPSASTSVPLGSFGWYEWDITDLVNSWIAGTVPNNGVQLLFGTVSSGTWIEWASRENPTAAWPPQLVIQ